MSFKQTIINAIIKVTDDPVNAQLNFETGQEARDNFITLLIAELFPEQPGVIIEQKKAKASPKPKEKKEKPVKEPKPPKEKKSKKSPVAPQPPTPEPATSNNNIMASVTEPLPPSPPSPKKKSKKAVFEGNLEKIDPTWRKWIKTAAKNSKVEFKKEDDAKFLEWVNKMTKEEFEALKNSADVSAYFPKVEVKSPAKKNKKSKKEEKPAEEEKVDADLTEVTFEGKTYYVNEENNRVYEPVGELDNETDLYADYKPVGYMGEGKFKNMKIE